jgi:hypothetical protein
MGCLRGAKPLFLSLPLSFKGEGDKGGKVDTTYILASIFQTEYYNDSIV